MKLPMQKGLATGFSTGACSAAAAKAALVGILTGEIPESIECQIPQGDLVTFKVERGEVTAGQIAKGESKAEEATAVVIKNSGDDPDVTDKAEITVTLSLTEKIGEISFSGGPGVGKVTLKGLGLEVGGPAINPVPRQNIADNLRSAGTELLKTSGLEVTISVPNGEAMAKKTLNERLGIVGGISILGTTGIVRPYSTLAFKACVVQGVEVAAVQDSDTVVLTTGGRTEKFMMAQFPQLPSSVFVQMGDFVHTALDQAVKEKIPKVLLGVMVGKLTKIAQGLKNTHAKRAQVDMKFLSDLAKKVGAKPQVCAEIEAAETARFASERLKEEGLEMAFYEALLAETMKTLQAKYDLEFQIMLCDFTGNKLLEIKS
ncbi:MAG: cobalt-precorrin-5B (C(1))-methyltransferase [SAR324 cluster bacterium]|nr:cobalt-precorrin-5B (C(1))-methyltransferase [SAR324 cluster bacterium]